jgi:hypothetical protein
MKSGVKKNIGRFKSRRGRLIVVDGVHWKWSCSSRGHVLLAYSEEGEHRCHTRPWVLFGWSQRDFEENQVAITPRDIERWLGNLIA